jgi:hypothetical protein
MPQCAQIKHAAETTAAKSTVQIKVETVSAKVKKQQKERTAKEVVRGGE